MLPSLLRIYVCAGLLLPQTTQRRQFFEFLQGDAERILDQVSTPGWHRLGSSSFFAMVGMALGPMQPSWRLPGRR